MDNAQSFVRHCKVYFSRRDDALLVAATWNRGGLIVERVGRVARSTCADAEAVGVLIAAKLAECEFTQNLDLSGRKSSEWPAFIASGLKTVRAFEESYFGVLVSGANAASGSTRSRGNRAASEETDRALCAAARPLTAESPVHVGPGGRARGVADRVDGHTRGNAPFVIVAP